MSQSSYDRDLERNVANFQPLTPLAFLEHAAQVFPDRLVSAHGPLRRNYRDSFKCPRTLVFAEVPKASTGKVQKFPLRERARNLGGSVR